MNITKTTKLWGSHSIDESKPLSFSIGDCNLKIKKENNALFVKSNHTNNYQISEHDWNKYLIKDKFNSIKLSPIMPDKNIIVKTDYPNWLTSNSSSTIFFKIPVWIKIEAECKNRLTITEIPSVLLSNTWFGDLDSGIICYHISTSAKSNYDLNKVKEHLVLNSINIENKSSINLLIEKLNIQVENLTIFQYENKFVSDHMVASFSNNDENISINFKKKPFDDFKNYKKITDTRKMSKSKLSFIQPNNKFLSVNILNIFSKK